MLSFQVAFHVELRVDLVRSQSDRLIIRFRCRSLCLAVSFRRVFLEFGVRIADLFDEFRFVQVDRRLKGNVSRFGRGQSKFKLFQRKILNRLVVGIFFFQRFQATIDRIRSFFRDLEFEFALLFRPFETCVHLPFQFGFKLSVARRDGEFHDRVVFVQIAEIDRFCGKRFHRGGKFRPFHVLFSVKKNLTVFVRAANAYDLIVLVDHEFDRGVDVETDVRKFFAFPFLFPACGERKRGTSKQRRKPDCRQTFSFHNKYLLFADPVTGRDLPFVLFLRLLNKSEARFVAGFRKIFFIFSATPSMRRDRRISLLYRLRILHTRVRRSVP